jgi:cation transporter-like permease
MTPPTRDLRRYARTTQVRIVIGALALLFGVGGILIYLFYGPGGAALGLVCFVTALTPVILIVLALWGLDRVARHGHEG